MTRKHALLIGINSYSGLNTLDYAVRDAEAVGNVLAECFGFLSHEITLMTSETPTIFTPGDFQPTRNNIEKQLLNLREVKYDTYESKGLDFLIVGFWGHGIGDPNCYLCACDTSERYYVQQGISLELLLALLKQAGAKNTCLILDCCQNKLEVAS